jgi:hypothetical protein
MDIPRELIYEEKESLIDFGISLDKSLNKVLFNEWFFSLPDLRPGDVGFPNRILQTFNDAYYICMVVLRWPSQCCYCLSYYLSKTKLPSVVMPLVYCYLDKVDFKHPAKDLLLKAIETEIKRKGWEDNYNSIKKIAAEKYKDTIPSSFFIKRKLNPDILSSVDWKALTDCFKPDGIKRIARIIAKDDKEIQDVAQAIKEAAKDAEDEFYSSTPNPELYEDCDECNYEPDYYKEPDDDYYDCRLPDYSDAYHLCDSLINSENPANLIGKKPAITHDRNINLFAPRKQLQMFLNEGDWFDNFSSDPQTYTKQWRNKMIEDLMNTNYGAFFANQWGSRHNMYKCGLVGALKDVSVIKSRKKTEIGKKLKDFLNLNINTIADYMAEDRLKPYVNWLKDYIDSSLEE